MTRFSSAPPGLFELRHPTLAAVVERATDLVAVADLNGNLVYLNPAGVTLLGGSPGAPFELLFTEEERSKLRDVVIPCVLAKGS